MAITSAQVYANAVNAQRSLKLKVGQCLSFSRRMAGAQGGVYDAKLAWSRTKYKHRGDANPPAGVPVWWLNNGHGHVAISAGNGYCLSTDVKRPGQVDKVAISTLTIRWGMRYQGWSEDINGVRISLPKKKVPKPPVKQTVDLSVVNAAARLATSTAGVAVVQNALRKEVGLDYSTGPGRWGPRTKKAYAAWQRKNKIKATGIPEMVSLKKLGARHGFVVKA